MAEFSRTRVRFPPPPQYYDNNNKIDEETMIIKIANILVVSIAKHKNDLFFSVI